MRYIVICFVAGRFLILPATVFLPPLQTTGTANGYILDGKTCPGHLPASRVAEREKVSFGLIKRGLEFQEQGWSARNVSLLTQLFQFLAEFNDAFGA